MSEDNDNPIPEEVEEQLEGEAFVIEVEEGAPAAPEPAGGTPADDPHRTLWLNVRRALYALPPLFDTQLRLAGIRTTDLHTLNSTLGSSIEQSVVDNLNDLRDIWDPPLEDGSRAYQAYSFVRQSQSWPDVLLQSGEPGATPIMGIELKGWFVLSKEGEPSFRYKVNADVATPRDLLAVYPWALDQVISGTPRLMRPFIAEARWAAQMRNHYWRFGRRQIGESAEINEAPDRVAYPKRGLKFSDNAKADRGGNFGRASRARIMDEFINDTFEEDAAGIPIKAWQAFFLTFRESVDLASVTTQIRASQMKHIKGDGTIEEQQLVALYSLMLNYIGTLTGERAAEVGPVVVGQEPKITVVVEAGAFEACDGTADPIMLPVWAEGLSFPVMIDRTRWTRIQKDIANDIPAFRLSIVPVGNVFHLQSVSRIANP